VYSEFGDGPFHKDSDVNFGDAFKTHVDEISAHLASRSARTHVAFQPSLRKLLPP
jgi:hypothetical protein